ncbi:MAG: type II secretion system protein [Candidatus Ozemobacteraceae bacterium]
MNNRTKGFSLLELIVAGGVFSLLAGILLLHFRQATLSENSLSARNEFQCLCGTIIDQLKLDLSSARILTIAPHRIDLERYTDWTPGKGLSTEVVSYFLQRQGIQIERNGVAHAKDFGNILKAVNGDIEFLVAAREYEKIKETWNTPVIVRIQVKPKKTEIPQGLSMKVSINAKSKEKPILDFTEKF